MIRRSWNSRLTHRNRSLAGQIVGIYLSEAITKSWVWLCLLSTAVGGTCLLFVAATYAQDARAPRVAKNTNEKTPNGIERNVVIKDSVAKESQPGWITFDRCIVMAPESFEIAAQETGVIADLTIAENGLVKAGQQIGKLDSQSAELERQVAGLQSQVASAEANDESDIRLAESVVEETTLQWNTFEEMGNKGGASAVEVRQKKIAVEQANVRLIRSKAEKVQRDLKAKLASSSYQLASQKVDRLKLVSPANGTVVRIDHRPGEWVAAGTAIAKVVRLDELRIDFFVDTEQLDPASLLGRSVTIQVSRGSAGNQVFAGKITGFASEVSSTGKILVNATVQNQQINDRWVLLPGMLVGLKLTPKS